MKTSHFLSDCADQLLVFGAGGHGRVVADAALLAGVWKTITASDRDAELCLGELLPGIALLDANAASLLAGRVHIAIGSNVARQAEAIFWGLSRLVSVVHPAAQISKFSHLSDGCFVAATAVVAPGSRLAEGVIVNHGAVVDHDVEVGAFSHIAPNGTLGGRSRIGQRVFVGAGAVILPAVHLADDVMVGAGSVVLADLLNAGTYAGSPARKIR